MIAQVRKEKSQLSDQRLGEPISEHRLRPTLRTAYLVLAFLGLTGAIAAGGIALGRWYFAYRHYGPAVVIRWSTPALGISLGLAVVGLLSSYAAWRFRSFCIYTFADGMIIERGRQREIIPWKDIRHIHTTVIQYSLPGWAWGARARLTLHRNGKRKLRLTESLVDLDSMTETIKRKVYPGLLEEYVQSLNNGENVPFGQTLLLTSQGIQYSHQTLSWSEVERATLNRGTLNIMAHPPDPKMDVQIKAHRVPNVDLCVQLIQHILTNP